MQQEDPREKRQPTPPAGQLEAPFRQMHLEIKHQPCVLYVLKLGAQSISISINPQLTGLFGYSPGEWRSNPGLWESRIHPDDLERLADARGRAQQVEGFFQAEYRMVDRAGDSVWVSDRAHFQPGEADESGRFIGSITEVVQAIDTPEPHLDRESMYQLLVDNTSELIVKVDSEGYFLFVSPSYCDLFGKSEAELLGKTFMPMVHEDDRQATKQEMQKLYSPPYTIYVEQRAMTKRGWRWLAWSDRAIIGPDGDIESIVGVGRDITERKRTEEAIRSSEERFRAVATATNDLIYEWDPETGRVRWWGDLDAAQGFCSGGLPATKDAWLQAIHPSDRKRFEERVARVLNSEVGMDIQYRIRSTGGDWRVWNDKARTLCRQREHPTIVIGGCADITAQRRAEEELQHLAFHDALTGLPNRILFKEELKQVWARYLRDGKRFALLFLDLDHFKDVNDSLGHPLGDELLQRVANRVKKEIRESDFFARLGGDEFALIQHDIRDNSEASIFAEKTIAAFDRDFKIGESSVHTACSVGIVAPQHKNFDVDELMSHADVALYKAKDSGRGTYAFFEDSMTLQLQHEMELLQRLRLAIDADELFVQYQPQLDLYSGNLVGLEALVRWNHPQRGILVPEDFLPIAEKRGLAKDISTWVVDTACHQAADWQKQGFRFGRIAINLCAAQVKDEQLPNALLEHIRRSGALPEWLELEFTETVLMDASDRTRDNIRRLSQLGFTFAVDDFGTGFSSLHYLKKYHADKIKIDRSFVKDLMVDPSDAEIIKAAIALGSALGLVVVAEGVETSEQAAFLKNSGCNQAQGAYFGNPQSAAHILSTYSR